MHHKLKLILLPDRFAVCRLSADDAMPDWAKGEFTCIVRTADELSVVCREDEVPAEVQCMKGRRCLSVAGVLDFSLVGVLASLLTPLAKSGVSVFVVSTFDTDYLLIEEADLSRATEALNKAGHEVA